jgi:hypothetical protein
VESVSGTEIAAITSCSPTCYVAARGCWQTTRYSRSLRSVRTTVRLSPFLHGLLTAHPDANVEMRALIRSAKSLSVRINAPIFSHA